MPLGVLEPFDLPRMTPNCERRVASTTASQSLLMMNNPFIIQQADALSAKVRATASELRAQQALAWRLVFGRNASDAELTIAAEFVSTAVAAAGPEKPDSAVTAMNEWCHALLCSSGFLYVE
jgi:hypothetical protein